LSQAAETAIDKSAEWVRLAQAAGADEGVEFPVVQVIFRDKTEGSPSDENAKARKRAENRIARLEAFSKMSAEVVLTWRKQLQQTIPSIKTVRAKNKKQKKERKKEANQLLRVRVLRSDDARQPCFRSWESS
jgi:hypothetical protein